MSEKIISIESHHPLDIFGAKDQNLDLMRQFIPKLKIFSRDNYVKAMGEETELLSFEGKFSLLLLHLEKFGKLTRNDISSLLEAEVSQLPESAGILSDILVHGKNGMLIRARTVNQSKLVMSVDENDLVFAIGPAGTG